MLGEGQAKPKKNVKVLRPVVWVDKTNPGRGGTLKPLWCDHFLVALYFSTKQLLGNFFFSHKKKNKRTTPYGGCLGSREDEERSEMRYVVRIAGTSESSSF